MTVERDIEKVREGDRVQIEALPRMRGNWSDLELSLYSTKWFDYRFMTPLEATEEYAKAFSIVYRETFARVVDRAAAEHITPLASADIAKLSASKRTGLWKGRQFADAFGMPYETYLTIAYEQMLRFWKQRHLPQPQQLYGQRLVGYLDAETGEPVEGSIPIAWKERHTASLVVASDWRYLNDHYVGAPAQIAHHDWLFDQAYLRPNPLAILASCIYRRKILPEAVVRERLPAVEFERLRSFA